jgi:hypothetical protein
VGDATPVVAETTAAAAHNLGLSDRAPEKE